MIRVLFDSTEINGNYILGLSQSVQPYSQVFSVGNTVCRQFTVDVKNVGFSAIPDNVYLYEDNGSDTQSNWTKYATLLVDTYEAQDGNYTTFSLTDVMVRFNKDLTYTLNDTVDTILDAICLDKGITFVTSAYYMSDFQITWTDELLERDFISYVAEVNGGYAYIDADGNLNIVELSLTPVNTISADTCSSYKIGARHQIDRVYVELASGTEFYPSTNTCDTLYLDPQNILFNDAQGYTVAGIVQHIYSVVNGFTFYNMEIGQCPIVPVIRACQLNKLTLDGTDYNFINTIDWNYNAKWLGGYKIELDCKVQEETQIVSSKEMVKRIDIKVDRVAGEISQEVSDLDESVTASLALKVDKTDNDQIISMINASADNIVLNTKSLIFGIYPNGQYIEVKNLYENSTAVGVTFDGTGTIRMQPQEKYSVNNINANGDFYNQFLMDKLGTSNGNQIRLLNYDDNNNYLTANFINLDAHRHDNSLNVDYNRLILNNYATVTGTQYTANYLTMSAYANSNNLRLYNFEPSSSSISNYISLQALANGNVLDLYNYVYGSANVPANHIIFNSTSTRSAMVLENYKSGTGNYANQVELSSMSVNGFYINNYKTTYDSTYAASEKYGNRLTMSSSDTVSTTYIYNNRPNQTDLPANYISMYGVPTGGDHNSVGIYNYDVDGGNVANSFTLSKSSSTNYVSITLYRGGNIVGTFSMEKSSSNEVSLRLAIQNASTYGYTPCSIRLRSSGRIDIAGSSVYFNNSQKW